MLVGADACEAHELGLSKPSTLHLYSSHTGALLGSFTGYRMANCASHNSPIAPHNALWFSSNDNIAYIDLDQPPMTMRLLSFAGYKPQAFSADTIILESVEDKESRDVLLYSPCFGYGARTRLPCAGPIGNLEAHSNAFFFSLQGNEQQLCAVILDAAPHPAPLTEKSIEAAFPLVETRVLATRCGSLSFLTPQRWCRSTQGPLFARMTGDPVVYCIK